MLVIKEPNNWESSTKFIILNEEAQVFCGLKRGYPSFSDNWDEARCLENDEQFKAVQRGTLFKLEKSFI
jgi:hypothetical protein